MEVVVASPLLDFVLDKLHEKAISKFAKLTRVDEELRKLGSTLSVFQLVLKDAEKRQGKEKALKNWLRELKDLAYDADEVLDDFAFKAHVTEKVWNFLSLSKKNKIAQRVNEINKTLDKIAEEGQKFHLKGVAGGSLKIESIPTRENTDLGIDGPEVYGRQEDKEKIVEILLNTLSGGDIGVICIVGLGGLGKTTLAQLVYQDERVCRHFEMKKSVVVSEESKIERVIGLIIEPAKGNNDAMQASLKQQFEKKRFLLVLDDVRSENHDTWDKLRCLLGVGAKGSKVIVTTRSKRVASIMGTIPPYQLSSLSLDDCWLLFKRRAFGNGVERENQNFVLIGREIMKKCGGVPLAAKALGSLLRFKRSEREWQAIQDSEVWKLSDDEYCEILSSLKLSYDYLSPCLKQCFAYCSIFQKDYDIDTNILVNLWGAEGFLELSAEHMHWEQIGLQFVGELLARSLFQKKSEGYVTMHDLVHDLARSVAGNECSIVNTATGEYISQNSRYVSFIGNGELLYTDVQGLRDTKKLRTIYLDAQTFYLNPTTEETKKKEQRAQEIVNIISNVNSLRVLHLRRYPLKALPDSFKKLKYLRYLDLSNNLLDFFPQCINTLYNLQTLSLCHSHIKSIPYSISNLHSLCTLDLSCSQIESLPESICTLSNLHTLRLQYCIYIHKLPQNMSDMKSLVHLDIYGCDELTCIPRGLGKLNRLRTLPIFIPGGETNCSLKELGSLKLEGKLEIKELQNVRSVDEAKGANLSDKNTIQLLKLSWPYENYSFNDPEDVLQCLQPSKSLEALEIDGYFGRTFPFWMMQSSLSNLVRVTLKHCACEKIPAFGQLPRLEVLNLVSLPQIKHLGSEFYGGANAFPSLQELKLSCLRGLEDWCSAGSEQFFPRLNELTLLDCPKLKALPSDFSSVEVLVMNGDDKLLLSSLQNGGFSKLKCIDLKDYDDEDPMPEELNMILSTGRTTLKSKIEFPRGAAWFHVR